MRDVSTNCHVLVLSAFTILLPLLFILNIIVIYTSRKFIVVASGTATSILIIIGLFLLFLL